MPLPYAAISAASDAATPAGTFQMTWNKSSFGKGYTRYPVRITFLMKNGAAEPAHNIAVTAILLKSFLRKSCATGSRLISRIIAADNLIVTVNTARKLRTISR